MGDAPLVEGRGCNGCTLCCKVLRVAELDKPKGEYCRHCAAGAGCTIYETRFDVCRAFHCGYLTTPEIGEHWHPAVSHMIVVPELGGERISVNVDTDWPEIWREPRYHDDLRQWARWGAAAMVGVVVVVGQDATVILPDHDVALGPVGEDEQVVLCQTSGPAGTWLGAMKLRNDDPRLAGAPLRTGSF
jgi:hypothetical protein